MVVFVRTEREGWYTPHIYTVTDEIVDAPLDAKRTVKVRVAAFSKTLQVERVFPPPIEPCDHIRG